MTQAMIREAGEEIGIHIQPENFSFVHVMHRVTDNERVDFFFTCSKWEGNPENKEPNKCDALEWFTMEELPENTIPYVKEAVGNYRHGIYFSEFDWNNH